MSNQGLIDAGTSSTKVVDLNTAAILVEAGGNADDIPLAQPQGARVIPVQFVTRGYQPNALNPKQTCDLIVVGDSSLLKTDLTGISGVTVNSFITDAVNSLKFATVKCSFENIPTIDALTHVVRYRLATQVRPQLDVAVPQTTTSLAWGGVPPGPYSKYTGKNVAIAVIDSGVYLTHGDFKKPGGASSRAILGWDQTAAGSPPAGFTYGVEYSASTLNTEATTHGYGNFSNVCRDNIGHGTPMAGIALGNADEADSAPYRYRYVGVAPEADLVIVKMPDIPSDFNIIDAVNWAFTRCAAMTPAKACVALITACNNRGAHDGTSDLDLALAALTGTNKLISAPAGNLGYYPAYHNSDGSLIGDMGFPMHARTVLTTVSATIKTIGYDVSGLDPNTSIGAMNEFVTVEGWLAGDGQYTVSVYDVVGGIDNLLVTATHGQDQSGTFTQSGRTVSCRVRNNVQTNSTGTKKKIEVYFYNDASQAHLWLTQFKIKVTRTGGSDTGGIVDWYVADGQIAGLNRLWNICNIRAAATDSGLISTASTLMSPGSCTKAICSGAYISRVHWPNNAGGESYADYNYVNRGIYDNTGQLLWFSGCGPLVGDSDYRPDICCPGDWIVAPLADTQVPSPGSEYTAPSQWHAAMGGFLVGGTSCAAAFSAGILAIMLQKYGTLTVAQARSIIRTLVLSDQKTGGVPNNTWGYGKITGYYLGGTVGVGPLPIPAPGGGPGADTVPSDPPVRRGIQGVPQPPKSMDPHLAGVPSGQVNFLQGIATDPNPNDTVVMDVFDSTSTIVRTVEREFASEGKNCFTWDYLTSSGRRAPNDTYTLRFTWRDQVYVHQVLVS